MTTDVLKKTHVKRLLLLLLLLFFMEKKYMGKGATWIGVKRLLWNQVFFKKKKKKKKLCKNLNKEKKFPDLILKIERLNRND